MTEQTKNKKPIIIDSSETSIESEILQKKLDKNYSSSNSSSVPDTSSYTSSSVPDTSTLLDESLSESESGNLEEEYMKLGNCDGEKYYSSDCNKFLLKKELLERNFLEENPDETPHLYPNLNDKKFNIKIASKKEFNDTKYDGKIYENIKEQSDILANADFELQPHQAFVKNFMSFQTPYNSLLLNHGLGSGKCHAKGTPIMLSDGTIELVENIKEGDFLMGDDSKPRRVLSIARGKDKMYDIIPVKGDKYTVNQEHILCLKNCEFPETSDNVLEISVKDYLELPDDKKKLLKGYKVPVDFPEKELPYDPYYIGQWLTDEENKDHFLNILKELNLLNNKHIPMLYKCNSRENRLKLLAGLIDIAGHLDKSSTKFELNLEKNEVLMDVVIYLARSLGFASYKEDINIGNTFCIHISGTGLEQIPKQIQTKRAIPRKQIKEDIKKEEMQIGNGGAIVAVDLYFHPKVSLKEFFALPISKR